jgi:hypothetical protein
MQKLIKSAGPHILAILSFLLISILYFLPQLQGKKIESNDIMHYRAMAHEVQQYKEKTGETALWTNSMFSGMPVYQITGPQQKNLMKPVRDLQQLFITRPIGYFVGAMIGFYILMLVLGLNPLLGAIGAIVFAFSTNNLVLFEAGHMTKLASVFSMPLYLAGVLLTFKKHYVYGFLLFSIGLAINILNNHLQMTYLLGILTAVLLVFYFFKYLKEKEMQHFVKVGILFAVGVVLAVATSASKIWTTYEYSKDTMRGKPILTAQSSTPNSSSETDGLEWNYAMNWSNGWKDLLSSYIPGAVGGGSAEPVGDNSAFVKQYRRLTGGRTLQDKVAPLYWGALPGTSGPIYFGALIFFLFLFGALIVRGPFKWWLVVGVVLTMFFSLGKNFEVFNRFFFDYFPYFNKFRAPNSILSITALLIPLMAILGIREITRYPDRKEEFIKKLYISFGILGGITLILALAGGALFDFRAPGDARYEQMNLLDALISDRKALLQSDSFKSFFYMLLGAAAIWLYLKKKLKLTYMVLAIALISFIDLFSVGSRYLNHKDFERSGRIAQDFRKRPVDEQILKDPDIHYRVLDLSINTFNSSMSSYYHKTIGGYHAAKLQRYQDLIDRHISQNNMEVLNMLNTKYVIQGQPGQETVVNNYDNHGDAWLVDQLSQVEDANAEIEALNAFNALEEAFYHQEYADYIGGFDPNGNGSILLTSYAPDRLTYQSNTNSDEFAVFSEIWYGPDKGWTAYVDGNESDFIRVNYALRGMKIPAGQHEIVFEFKPRSYYLGEQISMLSSGVLLLLLLLALGRDAFDYFKQENRKEA